MLSLYKLLFWLECRSQYPHFLKKKSAKWMCVLLKIVSFLLGSQRALQKKKCTRLRTSLCPFDAAVIIHKLLIFSICSFFLFQVLFISRFLSYKAVSFRFRGRRKNVHCVHDDCSVLQWSPSLTSLEEIVPHMGYTLLKRMNSVIPVCHDKDSVCITVPPLIFSCYVILCS